jgi:phosphatidylglycerophosphatase A
VNPKLLLITSLGLGHMRPASGTWGSLPPVVIASAMLYMGMIPVGSALVPWYAAQAALLIIFSLACIWGGQEAERAFGRKDPSQAVADETAGQALTIIASPIACLASYPGGIYWLAISFVLFRIMDIIKPPPARGLQRLPAGWGILIDDLLAALYAAAVMWSLYLGGVRF